MSSCKSNLICIIWILEHEFQQKKRFKNITTLAYVTLCIWCKPGEGTKNVLHDSLRLSPLGQNNELNKTWRKCQILLYYLVSPSPHRVLSICFVAYKKEKS